jgi:hypothetical protein
VNNIQLISKVFFVDLIVFVCPKIYVADLSSSLQLFMFVILFLHCYRLGFFCLFYCICLSQKLYVADLSSSL